MMMVLDGPSGGYIDWNPWSLKSFPVEGKGRLSLTVHFRLRRVSLITVLTLKVTSCYLTGNEKYSTSQDSPAMKTVCILRYDTSWHGHSFRIAGSLMREPMDSSHIGPAIQACYFMFFVCNLKQLWNRQPISDNLRHHGTHVMSFSHIEAETNLSSFRRRHFEMHFREWKCLNFAWDFTEVS